MTGRAPIGFRAGDRGISRTHSAIWSLVLALALALGAASTASAQPLNSEVQRLVRKHKLDADKIGLRVVELNDAGEEAGTLASLNANEALVPASNQKLLTTAAALWVLGPEFTFRTELRLVGDVLVIVGSGDPALADPEVLREAAAKLTTDEFLDKLTDAVKTAGATSLREVVADDRIFDRTFVHPAWAPRHLDDAYGAEVSGLMFHANVVSLFARPGGSVGRSPSIRPEPDLGFLEIENRAETVGGKNNTVWARRLDNENRLRIEGGVALASQSSMDVPLHNNPLVAARALAQRLEHRGVRVGVGGRRAHESARVANLGESFEGGRTVAVVTTPLIDVVNRCNTVSQNLYAEALLKRIGHEVTREPGTWENGSQVMRMMISQKLGPDAAAKTVVSDGSGLSDANRVSASTLVRWISTALSDPTIGAAFLNSLATPREGTLRSRFGRAGLKTSLQAKTGHVEGVLCLSGFLTHEASGRRVAFSLLTNGVPRGDKLTAAVELQKDFVQTLDGYLASKAEEPSAQVGGER